MEEVKNNDKKWCVYMHTNKINNKKYIGITCNDASRRWGLQGQGYRRQKHFWNAIQKYGWDNFEHEIIENNLTEDQAKIMEVELIKQYNSNNRQYGYNTSPGGDGGAPFGELNPFYGKHHTEETKKKISEAHKGMIVSDNVRKKLSEVHKRTWKDLEYRKKMTEKVKGVCNPRSKKINQYDLNGNFIRQCDYVKQAADELHIDVFGIYKCANGQQKTAGGFIWKYVENQNIDIGDVNEESIKS